MTFLKAHKIHNLTKNCRYWKTSEIIERT